METITSAHIFFLVLARKVSLAVTPKNVCRRHLAFALPFRNNFRSSGRLFCKDGKKSVFIDDFARIIESLTTGSSPSEPRLSPELVIPKAGSQNS